MTTLFRHARGPPFSELRLSYQDSSRYRRTRKNSPAGNSWREPYQDSGPSQGGTTMLSKVSALVMIACVVGLLIPAPSLAAPKTETPPGYYSIYWPTRIRVGGLHFRRSIPIRVSGTFHRAPRTPSESGLRAIPELISSPFRPGVRHRRSGVHDGQLGRLHFETLSFARFAKVNMMTGELTLDRTGARDELRRSRDRRLR